MCLAEYQAKKERERQTDIKRDSTQAADGTKTNPAKT